MTGNIRKAFTHPVISATLAAALALTPITAAPARADEAKVGAIAAASIIGLFAAGILANAAQNTERDTRGYRPAPPRANSRWNPRKALPEQCEITVHRGPDKGTYYTSRCLKRNFDYFSRLPERCEDKVWVPRRNRNVNAYDAQCLARFGYREEERPRHSRW